MANMSDIRRSIRSIESTGQITKAMKMVASAKLRRAQSAVIAARPYGDKIREVLGNLSEKGCSSHPLQVKREEIKNVLYILVTADAGLCGGFNSNLIKLCEKTIKNRKEDCAIVAVGKKGRDYFKKRDYKVIGEYVGNGDSPRFVLGQAVSEKVIPLYIDGEYDEVHLIFSRFRSAMSNTPTDIQILPIEAVEKSETAETTEKKEGYTSDYLFEPDEDEVLNALLPAYVETLIYDAIIESKASELGSKMTAMSSATDNANELIQSLTLTLNRARQAAITTEITEIVSGAAALE
jgi:F-type H+-transporting ATPase subunit gamma